MARREASVNNTVIIHDNMSNTDIKFTYRTPDTDERTGFSNLAVQRKGRKVTFNQGAARLKYGLRILTGVREGDFERKVDGKYVPLASDKASSNFYPGWKAWLTDNAADLVMLLGAFVFEGSAEIDEVPNEIDEPVGEEIEKNSPETLPQ